MEDPASQVEAAANREEQEQLSNINKLLIGGKYRGATNTSIIFVDKQEGYSPGKQSRKQDGQSNSAKF